MDTVKQSVLAIFSSLVLAGCLNDSNLVEVTGGNEIEQTDEDNDSTTTSMLRTEDPLMLDVGVDGIQEAFQNPATLLATVARRREVADRIHLALAWASEVGWAGRVEARSSRLIG